MSSRETWLTVKVANEGYCCPNAYLRLCRARGEAVKNMARNINISPDALWYHYRKLDRGGSNGPTCQRFSDCMDSIIREIEAEKTPAEAGERPPSKP
jgi:hypothetical protein